MSTPGIECSRVQSRHGSSPSSIMHERRSNLSRDKSHLRCENDLLPVLFGGKVFPPCGGGSFGFKRRCERRPGLFFLDGLCRNLGYWGICRDMRTFEIGHCGQKGRSARARTSEWPNKDEPTNRLTVPRASVHIDRARALGRRT